MNVYGTVSSRPFLLRHFTPLHCLHPHSQFNALHPVFIFMCENRNDPLLHMPPSSSFLTFVTFPITSSDHTSPYPSARLWRLPGAKETKEVILCSKYYLSLIVAKLRHRNSTTFLDPGSISQSTFIPGALL